MPDDYNKCSLTRERDRERSGPASQDVGGWTIQLDSPACPPIRRPVVQRRDFLCGRRKPPGVIESAAESDSRSERKDRPSAAVGAMGKRDRADRGERWRGRIRAVRPCCASRPVRVASGARRQLISAARACGDPRPLDSPASWAGWAGPERRDVATGGGPWLGVCGLASPAVARLPEALGGA